VTDTGGLLVGAEVDSADIQDRDGAMLVIEAIHPLFPWLRHRVCITSAPLLIRRLVWALCNMFTTKYNSSNSGSDTRRGHNCAIAAGRLRECDS
jgi:hypothetical protein